MSLKLLILLLFISLFIYFELLCPNNLIFQATSISAHKKNFQKRFQKVLKKAQENPGNLVS